MENIVKKNKQDNPTVSLVHLGGLGEIGKNMLAINYNEEEIIIIDAGLAFPDDEMFGIDHVIPDTTYLKERRDKVRGIFLTHGHEDHIGSLPYLLKEINVPVYGSRLTLGLVQGKLKEHGLLARAKLHRIMAGETVKIGHFGMEFIKVSHSIADVLAMAIHTPVGVIVHTADFKFDQTPIAGGVADFARFGELGKQGVRLLLSDSTNAERPGFTLSEREVGKAFNDAFRQAKGRIIIASFASNVYRVQQIVHAAVEHGRKVCVIGRSMINVASVAQELGYLEVPKGTMIELDEIHKYPANKVCIVSTGSQGEPMAALSRIAASDHRQVEIVPGDTVIISASPIPGNERPIGKTINALFKQGAHVIYESFSGVHVSGHASQEELKLMLNLVKPEYFVPVHGEYRMLHKHAQLARLTGVKDENIFIAENGDVIEMTQEKVRIAGKVSAGAVLVDGLGVGDVGNIVLRDRRQLAEDGIFIVVLGLDPQTNAVVAGPDIITRGFVYVRESEQLLEEARERVRKSLASAESQSIQEWGGIKNNVRETLSRFLYEKTKRRPMILPVIMEV